MHSCVLKSLQSCPTLWHPKDYIAHRAPLSMEILQTRTLGWVAMPFSRGSSQPRDRTHFSCFAGSLLHWQAGSLSFTIPLFNTSSLLHHLYLILLKHFCSEEYSQAFYYCNCYLFLAVFQHLKGMYFCPDCLFIHLLQCTYTLHLCEQLVILNMSELSLEDFLNKSWFQSIYLNSFWITSDSVFNTFNIYAMHPHECFKYSVWRQDWGIQK